MSLSDKTEATPGDPGHERPTDLACSFCGKTQDQVAKLIAGPRVYICDECIDLCNDIREQETPADQSTGQSTTFSLGAICVLCHLPKPSEEILTVPNRGFLCTVCLEAMRAAADAREAT